MTASRKIRRPAVDAARIAWRRTFAALDRAPTELAGELVAQIQAELATWPAPTNPLERWETGALQESPYTSSRARWLRVLTAIDRMPVTQGARLVELIREGLKHWPFRVRDTDAREAAPCE